MTVCNITAYEALNIINYEEQKSTKEVPLLIYYPINYETNIFIIFLF